MLVRDARSIALDYITSHAPAIPGFLGAYLAGSVTWLPEGAPFPATSDLDINIVVENQDQPDRRTKVVRDGLLLETTYLPRQRVETAGQVLSDYHLAGGFRTNGILADPTGHLTALQAEAAKDFAHREWVERRCAQARDRVLAGLTSLPQDAPLPSQVMAWTFPTGVTTHILLVAGLRNPTVRRRYAAVRELLEERGRLPFHEALLEALGSAHLTRDNVERHLAATSGAFDAAAPVVDSPFPFASDISAIARRTEIVGSQELIDQGLHREAMFWLAVTYSRCMLVLETDAPDLVERFERGYQSLLSDLGIHSFTDIQTRAEVVKRQLPTIWQLAQEILPEYM